MARYPNILCRVNAIKPEFIVRYVENFPKEPLPTTEFYKYVEQRMEGFHSRNYKQAPLQWGLYYEDNGYCYPRFNKNITNDEAKKYIEVWLHNLVVPNPYCSLSQIKDPVNLIVLLCEYMKSNPEVRNLHDIAYGACRERVKAIDILKNTIEQSNLFKIERGNIRFYKVKVKKEYEKYLTSCNNQEILLKLANYFKEVYDPEEELTLLPDNIIGRSISFDELKKLPNIDKVLEFKPEYNIIVDFASDFDKKYKSYNNMNSKEYFHLFDGVKTNFDKTVSLQQIFYGAPGTGKSHEINRLTEGENVIRTTFHPDSDYSTFVGCYKPHMEEVEMTTVIGETLKVVTDTSGQPRTEKRIVYKYSCQAFLQAYIAAWQHPDKVQYLVIEEINRGNCAQIFGDIFQLLDRNDEGYSSYPIKTDADAEDELRTLFAKEWNLIEERAKEIDDFYRKHYADGITKSIKDGSILLLPSNLYIWATMNTSDQSLFPIDSAFKRRWEWKYVKIAEGRDPETNEPLNWVVKFDYEEDDKTYTFECSWWQLILAINEKIANATSSDDKKLGYFFCKPKSQDSKEIDAERFVGKVVFYLWNDVFKDDDNAIFKIVEGKGDPSFDAFYTEDDNGKTVADTKALRMFMHNVFGEQSALFTEKAKETTNSAEAVTE